MLEEESRQVCPLETRFHFSVSISSTTLKTLSHRELKRGCCLVMFGQLNVPVRYEKSRGGRRSFPPFLEASHENPLIDRKLFGSMCRWNRGMASFREHWSSQNRFLLFALLLPLSPHSQTFLDIERTIQWQSASWLITGNCLYMEYKLGIRLCENIARTRVNVTAIEISNWEESNNDTSITRGNVIYYFPRLEGLPLPVEKSNSFAFVIFIEQFHFFFFFKIFSLRIQEEGFFVIPTIIQQYDQQRRDSWLIVFATNQA